MPPISPQRSELLDLPNLMPAQAQKHVTHNEALHHLDLVVQLVLEETERDTPPGAIATGCGWRMAPRSAGRHGRAAAAGLSRNPLTRRRW
ncbi:DUF2793 domain-containing protein [Tritonibacter mobilis]|uniref:DUF2793 domain-containing protein n=1 Tax=Tritonibacter mobilis TaxID=379347 RepID=UPI000806EA26|nr:DUF2793 domain-containing protein [Tritonibacter mobilis]